MTARTFVGSPRKLPSNWTGIIFGYSAGVAPATAQFTDVQTDKRNGANATLYTMIEVPQQVARDVRDAMQRDLMVLVVHDGEIRMGYVVDYQAKVSDANPLAYLVQFALQWSEEAL